MRLYDPEDVKKMIIPEYIDIHGNREVRFVDCDDMPVVIIQYKNGSASYKVSEYRGYES